MVALRCVHAPSLSFGTRRSVPIKIGRGISMKKFLALLLCVQLVLCAGVGQPAVYGLYIDSATKYVDWLIDSVKAAAES